MSTQQEAAPGLVLPARFSQHSQRLPQRLHTTGHQRRGNRLHPIAPEQIQQLKQTRQLLALQFREGQPQAAIDLQINARWREPIPLPVQAAGAGPNIQRLQCRNAAIVINSQAPAPLRHTDRFGQAQIRVPLHADVVKMPAVAVCR